MKPAAGCWVKVGVREVVGLLEVFLVVVAVGDGLLHYQGRHVEVAPVVGLVRMA